MNEVEKIKKEFLEAISILENKNFERLPKKEDVDSFTLKELVKIVCLYKTASSRISLIEEKLRRINNWTVVKPSEERGDYCTEDGKKYFELKMSSLNNTISALQIRPWHKVDTYVFIYVDCENLKIHYFELPSDKIKELVEGSKSITHGTRETTLNNNKNIEYSLHIRLNKSNDKFLNFFMENSINKGVINL